jgi:hypothetical protein
MEDSLSGIFFDVLILLLLDYIVYLYVLRKLYYQYRSAKKLIRSGVHVKGRITGYLDKEDLDHHTQYAPIVDFVDKEGNCRQIASDEYKYREPVVHVIVDVYYDNEDPTVVIVDFGSLLLFRAFLLIFSIVVCLSVNLGMLHEILR